MVQAVSVKLDVSLEDLESAVLAEKLTRSEDRVIKALGSMQQPLFMVVQQARDPSLAALVLLALV